MTGTWPPELYERALERLDQSTLLEETPALRLLLEKLVRELPEESRPDPDASPEYRVDDCGDVLVVFQPSPGVHEVLGDLAATASDAGDVQVAVRVPATALGRVDENTREAVVTAWSGGKLAFRYGPGFTDGLREVGQWFLDARGGVPLTADQAGDSAAQRGTLHLRAPAEFVARLVELGVAQQALGVEPPEGAFTFIVDGPSPTFATLVRDRKAIEVYRRELHRWLRGGRHRSRGFRAEGWRRGDGEHDDNPTGNPNGS